MFNELRDRIQGSIVARIFRVQVQRNAPPPPPSPLVREVLESGPGDPDGSDKPGRNGAPKQRRAAPVGAAAATGGEAGAAKLGRNDPCWCGSGKKYKRCHGR
jgi:preprotein translocase subunit SecA